MCYLGNRGLWFVVVDIHAKLVRLGVLKNPSIGEKVPQKCQLKNLFESNT